MEKFPVLMAQLMEPLSKVLLSDHFLIKNKESFTKDRKLDYIIFEMST